MSINLPNLCLPPEGFSAENVLDGLDRHLPAGPGRKAERMRSGVRTQHRLVCLLNGDMCFTSSRGVGSLPFVLTESWLVFHFPALVETPGQRNPSPPEENQQCKGVGKWWVMFSAGGVPGGQGGLRRTQGRVPSEGAVMTLLRRITALREWGPVCTDLRAG